MKHTQDEILIYKEIAASGLIFRLEEYWEEDDAGFCCVDYVLEKHTRLRVLEETSGKTLRLFDYDSKEYDKDMTLDGDILTVTYHPECNEEAVKKLQIPSLEEIQVNTFKTI